MKLTTNKNTRRLVNRHNVPIFKKELEVGRDRDNQVLNQEEKYKMQYL